MSIWFFSDPHIGVKRSSHTTEASRVRLSDAVFSTSEAVLYKAGSDPVICTGDLFDKEANSEADILRGHRIAAGCTMVLGGNHDLPNRAGAVSSLQLLDEILPSGRIISGTVDEAGFSIKALQQGTFVYAVPHLSTQELFETSLQEAAAAARGERNVRTRILCLHCNYDSGLIQNDASLNLPKALAEVLLQVFDYVLLGHEHMPRELLGGRLIILGNTHPTSFADISDKYLWEFSVEKGFTKHLIWSADAGALRVELLSPITVDAELAKYPSLQFLDIVGAIKAEEAADVAALVAYLWKNVPSLLMVRNNTEVSDKPTSAVTPEHKTLDLPARVASALDDEMRALWNDYLEKVK